MPTKVRQIRPALEPLSPAALGVLHVLEPVVGRIIGIAILKFACGRATVDAATLTNSEIERLVDDIASSLSFYDRAASVSEALRRLARRAGGAGGDA